MDLFEHYETLPKEVQDVLEKFSNEDSTYETCAKLIDDLKPLGYTCEYYLDAEPCELRKLSIFDEWTPEKIDKVFDAVLDEMSHSEAEELRGEVRTYEEKIRYFIEQQEKFENSLK